MRIGHGQTFRFFPGLLTIIPMGTFRFDLLQTRFLLIMWGQSYLLAVEYSLLSFELSNLKILLSNKC